VKSRSRRSGVAVENVATRVSTNGAATFTTTGIADQALVPLCFFDGRRTPSPGLETAPS
jgi:hypothetical protein